MFLFVLLFNIVIVLNIIMYFCFVLKLFVEVFFVVFVVGNKFLCDVSYRNIVCYLFVVI